MKRHGLCVPLLLVAVLGLSACAPSAAPPPQLTPVTVQLVWTHGAQFAGFYAAVRQGYYAAEGLAVTFLEGGPQADPAGVVLAGKARFGVASADQLLLDRAGGKPVRAIATIYRRSPIVFITLAASGITRPQQFAGKTIRVVPNIVPSLRAMLARVGVRPGQYTEVILPTDLEQFASGRVPIWGAYVTALALRAERAGHKINHIFPEEYGVRFYADSVFAADETIAANPDLVGRFLRATLKGWAFAAQNAGEAAPLVAKYKPDADVGFETAQMLASLPLVHTGEDHIGWMQPAVWAEMAAILQRYGVLAKPVDPTQAYTLQFLEGIYR